MAVSLVLGVQLCTYLGLGSIFLVCGKWKLGVAQILLAGVQGLLFS